MATSGQRNTVRARKTKPAASEMAAALIDVSRDGVVAFDRAGRITAWSQAAAALTGLAAKGLVGRSLARKVPWLAGADGGRPFGATLEGTTATSRIRLDHAGADGCVVDVRWQPVTDDGGTLRGGLAILCPVEAPSACEPRRKPRSFGTTRRLGRPARRTRRDVAARAASAARRRARGARSRLRHLRRRRPAAHVQRQVSATCAARARSPPAPPTRP